MSTVFPLKMGAKSCAKAPTVSSIATAQTTDRNARTAPPILLLHEIQKSVAKKAVRINHVRRHAHACRGASTSFLPSISKQGVDGRNKSGHDRVRTKDALPASAALYAHRNAHAAANAQRGEAFLGVTLLHFVEQRDQHPRAGRTDRMPQCDRATVDVDLAGVPPEVLVDGAGLGRKRLVGLDEIEVADRPASLLQRRAGSRDRTGAHDGGVDPRVGPRHDACQYLPV